MLLSAYNCKYGCVCVYLSPDRNAITWIVHSSGAGWSSSSTKTYFTTQANRCWGRCWNAASAVNATLQRGASSDACLANRETCNVQRATQNWKSQVTLWFCATKPQAIKDAMTVDGSDRTSSSGHISSTGHTHTHTCTLTCVCFHYKNC